MVKFVFKGYQVISNFKPGRKNNFIEIREMTTEGNKKVHSISFTENMNESLSKAREWINEKKAAKKEVFEEKKIAKKEAVEEKNVFIPIDDKVEDVKPAA